MTKLTKNICSTCPLKKIIYNLVPELFYFVIIGIERFYSGSSFYIVLAVIWHFANPIYLAVVNYRIYYTKKRKGFILSCFVLAIYSVVPIIIKNIYYHYNPPNIIVINVFDKFLMISVYVLLILTWAILYGMKKWKRCEQNGTSN